MLNISIAKVELWGYHANPKI